MMTFIAARAAAQSDCRFPCRCDVPGGFLVELFHGMFQREWCKSNVDLLNWENFN